MQRRLLFVGMLGALLLGGAVLGTVMLIRRGPAPGTTPTPVPSPHVGLPSAAESPCPDAWAGLADTDTDVLPDALEEQFASNPAIPDTDGDSHTDGDEVKNGYDPARPGGARLDRDADGLLEHEECRWTTDPTLPDTDGDGFRDGDEVKNGFDPTVAGDGRGSDRLRTLSSPTPPASSPTPPFPVIPRSQPADIRAYLTVVDGIRPRSLLETAVLADALREAFQGQPQKLAAVRAEIRAYGARLQSVPTPNAAVAHHTLFLSLIHTVDTELGTMEQYAVTDPARVTAAALGLQQTLPPAIERLRALRLELDQLAAAR